MARQYSGTLGKRANCQVATSLHYASGRGDYPLAPRQYLPATWPGNPDRLKQARVPSDEWAFKIRWQIALDVLGAVRAERLPHALAVADAGYGAVTEFREGLEQRQEHDIVGLLGDEVVLTKPPRWIPHAPKRAHGRRPSRAYLAEDGPRPVAIGTLAETLERTPVCWREGTKGKLEAEFAWIRVWPAHRWGNGVPAEAVPDAEASARWLLVEWRKDDTIKYALSTLPPDATLEQAVGRWKERWQVERGYEQLTGELGLDHFEGRG